MERRRRAPSPLVGREERGVWLPAAQVDAARRWWRRRRRRRLDLDGAQHRTTIGRTSPRRRAADRGATTGTPGQIPLGDEQAVRRRDRVPRDPEFSGQFPRRWQRIALREHTRLDRVADLVVDRPGRASAAARIEVDLHARRQLVGAAGTSTAISGPSTAPPARSSRSPLQKRPGSYQLSGLRSSSRPIR